jgi:hypothetical protein
MLVHVRNWCFSCLKINKFNITNAVNFTTHMHRILQLLPHNNICNHFITEKHKTYTFANVWNVEHPTSQTKLRTCMSRFNLNATNNCRNIITLHFLDHRIYIRLGVNPCAREGWVQETRGLYICIYWSSGLRRWT